MDNDIIGKDINRFDQLLDELSKIKEETPNFTISLAEVITKGINSDIIKKMALAGFIHVQIGYESPSNSLLTKINKKNTFASNMLFIKYAKKYKINIGGANVIMGMYEEQGEDIIEAINNLPLQRFLLKHDFFSHNASPLGVMHSSRYFKLYQEEAHLYEDSTIMRLIPSKYNQFEDSDLHITEKIKTKYNPLWTSFFETEKYYLTNNYEYELLSKKDSILYREYLNSGIINELEFERGAIDWIILEFCNDSVRSINEIVSLLKTTSHPELLDIELYNIIDELYVERLVYVSDNYSEIVTIIDTKLVL